MNHIFIFLRKYSELIRSVKVSNIMKTGFEAWEWIMTVSTKGNSGMPGIRISGYEVIPVVVVLFCLSACMPSGNQSGAQTEEPLPVMDSDEEMDPAVLKEDVWQSLAEIAKDPEKPELAYRMGLGALEAGKGESVANAIRFLASNRNEEQILPSWLYAARLGAALAEMDPKLFDTMQSELRENYIDRKGELERFVRNSLEEEYEQRVQARKQELERREEEGKNAEVDEKVAEARVNNPFEDLVYDNAVLEAGRNQAKALDESLLELNLDVKTAVAVSSLTGQFAALQSHGSNSEDVGMALKTSQIWDRARIDRHLRAHYTQSELLGSFQIEDYRLGLWNPPLRLLQQILMDGTEAAKREGIAYAIGLLDEDLEGYAGLRLQIAYLSLIGNLCYQTDHPELASYVLLPLEERLAQYNLLLESRRKKNPVPTELPENPTLVDILRTGREEKPQPIFQFQQFRNYRDLARQETEKPGFEEQVRGWSPEDGFDPIAGYYKQSLSSSRYGIPAVRLLAEVIASHPETAEFSDALRTVLTPEEPVEERVAAGALLSAVASFSLADELWEVRRDKEARAWLDFGTGILESVKGSDFFEADYPTYQRLRGELEKHPRDSSLQMEMDREIGRMKGTFEIYEKVRDYQSQVGVVVDGGSGEHPQEKNLKILAHYHRGEGKHMKDQLSSLSEEERVGALLFLSRDIWPDRKQ